MNNYILEGDRITDGFRQRLVSAYRKEGTFNVLKNFLISVFVFLLAAVAFILTEAIFHSGSSVRTILFWGFILTSATTFTYIILSYIFRLSGLFYKFDLSTYSRYAGNKFDDIKDKVGNSLSIFSNYKSGKDKGHFSEELIFSDLTETNETSKKINFSSIVKYSNLKKYLLRFGAVVIITVILFSVFPNSLFSSLNRIVKYKFNFLDNENGIIFRVEPGDMESFSGDKVQVNIEVEATKENINIDEIKFYVKDITKDGAQVLNSERILKAGDKGIFSTLIENINSDLIYYAEYKDIKSKFYKITLAEFPVIKKFNITIVPPEFTGLPEKKLNENQGDIYCIQGSTIKVELNASKELSTCGVQVNGEFVSLKTDGLNASGSFKATQSGEYKFILKDKDGNSGKNAKGYLIKLVIDEPPKIEIIEPEEVNHSVYNQKEITVRARITDDFGFSTLTFSFAKKRNAGTASVQYTTINIPIQNKNATSLEIPYVWYLNDLKLKSGEAVEYYMEVTDNTGKTTRSDLRTIIYKSAAEFLKQQQKNTNEITANLKAIKEDIEKLEKKTQDVLQNKNQQELGVNEQSNKDLLNKIENIQTNMDNVQKKIQEGLNEMQNNKLSEKTIEQYLKLQELFNKINTPEFREQLKKLQDALRKNDPKEITEQMRNMNFDEEAFKKQMEQLMELMQKIQNLQKFGELTQKLDDIKKEQGDIKNQTENTDPNNKEKLDNLAQKQMQLEDKMKDFQKELNDLIKELNKMREDISPNDLENLQKKMQNKKTSEKMNKSGKQLNNGDKKNSEQTQDEIMQDLEEMNEDMQDALENAMDSQQMMEKLMNKMKSIKKNLEEISEKQGDLKDKTDGTKNSDKSGMDNLRKEQQGLQQKLSDAINDLMNLSKEGVQITPEMGKELGNAFNSMDKAQTNMQDGDKNNATKNQGKAKESLDKAIKMLGDMMDKMKQDGKSGKKPGNGRMGMLLQRLAQLIAQQQALNGQMSDQCQNGKMGKDGRGGNEEMQMKDKEKIERLKLEQQGIQKSLDELNKEFEKEFQKTGEKPLGDLNEVIKNMQEVIKDLEQNKLDEKTLEKQNKILSRMLEFQLSQREKELEQKRESRPGDNVVRNSPSEIILSGPKSFNAFKEDFLKLQKEGYVEEYEALITKYLMEISKLKLK